MSIAPFRGSVKWASMKEQTIEASRLLTAAALSCSDLEAAGRLAKRAGRMSMCSNQIIVSRNKETGETQVERAALCRDRLCPICSWRLAARRVYEMRETIAALLADTPDIKAAMLTLTVRNCAKSELRSTIQGLCSGFTRLRKHAAFRRYVLGYARSIEITYNADNQTFHPHIHALLLFDASYKAYITQAEFADMWRTAARLDYTPIVDIRYAYNKADEAAASNELPEAAAEFDALAALSKSIIEATKYAIKPGALKALLSDAEAASLATQIAGHRLIAYGGIIKDYRARCGFTDRDDPAPSDHIPLVTAPGGTVERLAYTWAASAGDWLYSGIILDEHQAEIHLYPSFRPHKRKC